MPSCHPTNGHVPRSPRQRMGISLPADNQRTWTLMPTPRGRTLDMSPRVPPGEWTCRVPGEPPDMPPAAPFRPVDMSPVIRRRIDMSRALGAHRTCFPQRFRTMGMSRSPSHHRTCPTRPSTSLEEGTCSAHPSQRMGMSLLSRTTDARFQVPTPRRNGWTCPPDARPEPLGMSPGEAHPSAFMWFFIDKPTRTKIKSNNSTSCDGSHRSGRGAFPAQRHGKNRKPSQTQYAMEGKCSPKNASS